MRMRIILFTIFLFSYTLGQDQYIYLSKLNYGSPIPFGGARSLALGGSGIAGASVEQSLYKNPALLHRIDNEFYATLNLYADNREEDRAYPYFDNFGGFVDYGSYVFNSNWYADAAFHLAADLSTWLPVVLGVGFGSFADYQYDYVEEVRSQDFGDALLAYNKIRSEGSLREFRFGVGGEIYDNIWLGLQVNTIWGDVTQKSEIDSVDPDSRNIRQQEKVNFKPDGMPLRFVVGAHYRINEKLSIGATIHLPHEIDFITGYAIKTQDVTLTRPLNKYGIFDSQFSSTTGIYDSMSTSSVNRILKYPLSYGFGLEYRFTNILEARINADFEYAFWSDFKDNLRPDLTFDDTYTINFGVEHIFFDQLPFRVGFLYGSMRENRQNTRTVFTAGIGLVIQSVQIDFSAGIENMTVRETDIFDDGIYPSYETRIDPVDRVELSNLYSMLEIHFNFGLIK